MLNQLIKQWQNAGQVDRAVYQEINQQFNLVLQPIKSAIKLFHQENKSLKQQLILNAEKLLAEDDIFAAVNQVKSLQIQWRNTGYAGPKIENNLWQSFRKINDNIFAKRDQKSLLEKSATTAKAAELESTLTNLIAEFSQVTELNELQNFEQALQSLHSDVAQQKPKMVNLEKQISAKEKSIAKKIVDFKYANEKRQWGYLFSILEESISNDKSFTEHNDYLHLTAFWQKKLKELANNVTHFNREDATLELEILSGIPSPSELQQRRMKVQVNLMQAQMSSGATIDLPDKFAQWLMLGKLGQHDLVLLERIKPIFQ